MKSLTFCHDLCNEVRMVVRIEPLMLVQTIVADLFQHLLSFSLCLLTIKLPGIQNVGNIEFSKINVLFLLLFLVLIDVGFKQVRGK